MTVLITEELRRSVAAKTLLTGNTAEKKFALNYLHGVTAYGCYDHAPYVDTLVVQYGLSEPSDQNWGTLHRTALYTEIPNVASKDCQYTRRPANNADRRCIGCIWKSTNPDLSDS